MHNYTVKTQEGTAKITAPSPAKATKLTTGGSVIRCKSRKSTVTVTKGHYNVYYKEAQR